MIRRPPLFPTQPQTRLATAFVLAALTAGCGPYLARQDRIAFAAGDAQAHNAIVQMVDPWPRTAFRPDMPTDGVTAAAAVERRRAVAGAAQGANPSLLNAIGGN